MNASTDIYLFMRRVSDREITHAYAANNLVGHTPDQIAAQLIAMTNKKQAFL